MEAETYTPASPKFVFEKIKFKFLHYNLNDFIRQRPEFRKDRLVGSGVLLLVISSPNITTHSNGYIKGNKCLFFINFCFFSLYIYIYIYIERERERETDR